jgi:hypothetical protein
MIREVYKRWLASLPFFAIMMDEVDDLKDADYKMKQKTGFWARRTRHNQVGEVPVWIQPWRGGKYHSYGVPPFFLASIGAFSWYWTKWTLVNCKLSKRNLKAIMQFLCTTVLAVIDVVDKLPEERL